MADDPPSKPPASSWASPLGIIALFLTVTETVTGLAVMRATGGVQVALTAYVIALPLLVLAVFAAILWVKPYVLYPPSEYGSGTNVVDFVDAMRSRYDGVLQRREVDESRIYAIVQDALKAAVAARATPAGGTAPAADEAEKIGALALARVNEQLLTVDTSPLGGAKKTRKIPIDETLTVSQLLDDVYFSIADRVEIGSYGRQWLLQDVKTGRIFAEMGRAWAAGHGKPEDDRRLGEVGIGPGMWLQTIVPSRAR